MPKSNKKVKEFFAQVKIGLIEVRKQYVNWFGLFLLIGFIIFNLTFKVYPNTPKTFKIIAMIILALSYTVLTVYINIKFKDRRNLIFLEFVVLTILWLSTLAFIATSVNEATLAVFSILTMVFVIYFLFAIGGVQTFIQSLMKESKVYFLIPAYIYCVGCIILLFVVFYLFLVTPSDYLYNPLSNSTITEFSDTLYYSASNFYTSTYGDIIPIGNRMRTISLIQVLISFIIHVILISRLVPNKKENAKKIIQKGKRKSKTG